ncbi:MAG: YciI family protein [Dehalococcoidia bacterium]
MPEFMMIIADDEAAREGIPPEEFGASYAKVGEWWSELERQGRMVPGAGRRLQPVRTARTVRVGNGKAAVTDGPFAETKEAMGGFGILTVPDIQAALDIVRSWPGLPVAIELRPVMEG